MIILLFLFIFWRKCWIISIVHPWWWQKCRIISIVHPLWCVTMGGLWKLSYTWVTTMVGLWKLSNTWVTYIKRNNRNWRDGLFRYHLKRVVSYWHGYIWYVTFLGGTQFWFFLLGGIFRDSLGNETQNLRAPHPGIFPKIAPPLALTQFNIWIRLR